MTTLSMFCDAAAFRITKHFICGEGRSNFSGNVIKEDNEMINIDNHDHFA